MVFVLDSHKQPLDPCHEARARKLLKKGRAAVYRTYPFTIILKDRIAADSVTHDHRLKLDPGSKTTGIAIVQQGTERVVFAAKLSHRGQAIRDALLARRAIRRNRRSRHTRYRKPRFLNRRRADGWLAPSLDHRVQTSLTWVRRLTQLCPIDSISLELVKFDTQLMQNAEIAGVQYQQGELAGYEIREYLLEKWGRKCAYCGTIGVPLQVEHLVPQARGGSNRVSNLALACEDCNQKKGNRTASEYGFPQLMQAASQPLKDAAAVNSVRWALWRLLSTLGLSLETSSGGRTKYNRTCLGWEKAHWRDAACVGASTSDRLTVATRNVLQSRPKATAVARCAERTPAASRSGISSARSGSLAFKPATWYERLSRKARERGRIQGVCWCGRPGGSTSQQSRGGKPGLAIATAVSFSVPMGTPMD